MAKKLREKTGKAVCIAPNVFAYNSGTFDVYYWLWIDDLHAENHGTEEDLLAVYNKLMKE